MLILPVFAFYNPQTVEKHLLLLIQYIQEQDINIRLSIQTSVEILSKLDNAVQQQLIPFISSKRIHIFPECSNASLQGLMNIQHLRKQLQKNLRTFSKLYPDLPPVSIPRWHDYHREGVQSLYRELLKTALLPTEENGILNYYRVFNGNGDGQIMPRIVPADIGARQFPAWLNKEIQQTKRAVKQLTAKGLLQPQDRWDTMIMFDGDHFCQRALDALSTIAKKKYEFTCGRAGLQCLRIINQKEPADRKRQLFSAGIEPTVFAPAYFGPEFVVQFFPSSKSKARRKPSFSTALPLPLPHQRVETSRPNREMTLSLLGRALLAEQELQVQFIDGDLSTISQGKRVFPIGGGIKSSLTIQKEDKQKKTCAFNIENAVAVEGGVSRGLRQMLNLRCQGVQIDGRITNDFLILEDQRELYLDSYIQHPWIMEGYTLSHYIPQMLNLWTDIAEGTPLQLSSQNTDGSQRSISVDFSKTGRRKRIFLPGHAWILSCGIWNIGIDLVYGRELDINLPSAILIEQCGRRSYKISFLPTAEYINPDITVLNGLMEHYSLRIVPAVSRFDEFSATEPQVTIDHIDRPFIIYF